MNKIVLSLMGIMLLSGCSTIIEGSTQTVNISTGMDKQIHAVITSSSGTMPVILPQALAVNKSSNDLVINIKDGNCVLPSTTIVKSHLNPWFWGNIIFGGLIGSTTDSASGAAWEYDNNILVNVALKDGCQ